MIGETYDFKTFDNAEKFVFISKGKNGDIFKYVLFQEEDSNLYNLAFGDLKNGKISDSIISNNNDLLKVMNTIGQIVYEFIEIYPEATISIVPIDVKRSKLYHTIFSRRIEEILLNFVLEGANIFNQWEKFDKFKTYQKFRLTKNKS